MAKSLQHGASIEFIADQMGIQPSAASLDIKHTINKLVNIMRNETQAEMLDICLAIIDYFNMEPNELFKKLDSKNMTILKSNASDRLTDGTFEFDGLSADSDFDELFD